VEVKIGVQHVNRELTLDTNQEGDEIEAAVAKALSEGEGLLSLTDVKGRRIVVPTAKIAYIEMGSPTIGQVGFRS
jgi:hypothetical protein